MALDSSIGILGRVQIEGADSAADIVLGLDTNLISIARNTRLLLLMAWPAKPITCRSRSLMTPSCRLIGAILPLSMTPVACPHHPLPSMN